MSGYTKGPWNARPKRGDTDSWWVTAAPPRPGHAGFVAECVARQSENEANARLIASAPDLLAALHLAAEALDAYSDVNDGEDGPTPNRAMSALQEIGIVIAKAEGKPR